jgi:hypothetical protein
MSWAERSTGISPTITQVLFAHMLGGGRQHRRRYRPTIDEQIEARRAPFLWTTILDTRVLIAEDLGAAPAPLALAQVEC